MKLLKYSLLHTAVSIAVCSQAEATENLYQTALITNPDQISFPQQMAKDEQSLVQSIAEAVAKEKILVANDSTFELTHVQESLADKHYTFVQMIDGVVVADSTIIVTVTKDTQEVVKVFHNVVDLQMPKKRSKRHAGHPENSRRNGVSTEKGATINAHEALEIAFNNLKPQGDLLAEPKSVLVLYPHQEKLVKSYKTTIALSEPKGEWLQYIDANTGQVLHLEQRMRRAHGVHQKLTDLKTSHFHTKTQTVTLNTARSALSETLPPASSVAVGNKYVQGEGQVFDPDPVTTLMDPTLSDTSPASAFDLAYQKVILPQVLKMTDASGDDVYHLESPWVKITNFEKPNTQPQTSTDGKWQFKRGHGGFDDTNVFYHLNKSQGYIQSLGYTGTQGILNEQVLVDTNGALGETNAYYTDGEFRISFGQGDINASEDADVILHEYGHAITFAINPSFYGGDTGAMGEGFGDYWGASYSWTTQNGSVFQPNTMGQWFTYKRTLNDVDARYKDHQRYGAHEDIDGVTNRSDQLWSTPLYQSFLELTGMGYSRENIDRIILQSMYGMGSNITMRMMAQSVVKTASRLYPTDAYAEVFQRHFKNHHILPKALVFGMERTLGAGTDKSVKLTDELMPGEVVRIRPQLLNNADSKATNVQASISGTGLHIMQANVLLNDIEPHRAQQSASALSFQVPDTAVCGSELDFEIDYQAYINGNLVAGQWKLSDAFGDGDRKLGIPEKRVWFKSEEQSLSAGVMSESSFYLPAITVPPEELLFFIEVENSESTYVEVKIQSNDKGEFHDIVYGEPIYNDGMFKRPLAMPLSGLSLEGQWTIQVIAEGDVTLKRWGFYHESKTARVCEPKLQTIEQVQVSEGQKGVIKPLTTLPLTSDMSLQWKQTDTTGVKLNIQRSDNVFEFQAPNVNDDQTFEVELSLLKNGTVIETKQIPILVANDNQTPTLSVVDTLSVNENETVQLQAMASDADGHHLEFSWKQVDSSGHTVSLINPKSAIPSFTAPKVDADMVLMFEVYASDGKTESEKKTVTVIVKNKRSFLGRVKDWFKGWL
ncbi:PKD domain-containing protein [Algicola sagamiensis]|uniref:PKD domain-containing protein n=1 Tax=Algicola sagamiensis TaxID=163869 RepID=UPI00035D7153|nr:hypothetical protein [Algicola sagamiensis]